jgi:hypothetical protein
MNETDIDIELENLNEIIGLNEWLKSTTPTNRKAEMQKVFASSAYNPIFKLPGVDFYVGDVDTKLDIIEVNTSNSVTGAMQREVVKEFRLYLKSMLARSSSEFQDTTVALRERPDADSIGWAEEWYPKEVEKEREVVTPSLFKLELEQYLKACGIERHYDIEISDEREGILVLQEEGRIIIPNRNRTHSELNGLKVHEIGTHIVQYENGSQQDNGMFRYGFPRMPFTSEGLALFNEQRVGAETDFKRKKRAGIIKAMVMAQECSFADIYNELLGAGFSKKDAFSCAYSAKRGFSDTSKPGANFNRNIYCAGLRKVKAYLDGGGDEDILYTGRVSLECLDAIRTIGFKPPKYKPRFDLD